MEHKEAATGERLIAMRIKKQEQMYGRAECLLNNLCTQREGKYLNA